MGMANFGVIGPDGTADHALWGTLDTAYDVIFRAASTDTTCDWNWPTANTSYFDGYHSNRKWEYSYEQLVYFYRFPAYRDYVPIWMRSRIARELDRRGWHHVNFCPLKRAKVYKTRHFHRTDPRWSNRTWKCKTRGQPLPRTYHRKKSLLRV